MKRLIVKEVAKVTRQLNTRSRCLESQPLISSHRSHQVLAGCIQKRGYCMSAEPDAAGEARNINLKPAIPKPGSVMYLDTLLLTKRFQNKGFSVEQAEVMTEAFSDVLNTAMDYHTKVMVTKPQQEIMVQQLLAQIAAVKKDMVILEKSEFTMIRNDTEKQGIMIKQMENKLDDSLKKLSGQIKLDLNLEKSRSIEAHAINEKHLQSLLNRMEVEGANNEKNLKAVDNKIEIELSNLRTQNEKYRNDFLKFMIGILGSAATIYLGYMRLMM